MLHSNPKHIDQNEEALLSDLNITPFVDVMLVLLIVFMVTLPMINHAVSLELPRVSSVPIEIQEQTISLKVATHQQIYWNDRPLTSVKALEHYLTTLDFQQEKPQVYLAMDQKLPYGLAAEILAVLQKVGIHNIGFVSEAPPIPQHKN